MLKGPGQFRVTTRFHIDESCPSQHATPPFLTPASQPNQTGSFKHTSYTPGVIRMSVQSCSCGCSKLLTPVYEGRFQVGGTSWWGSQNPLLAVRVECPIVSAVGEGSGRGSFLPPGPGVLALIPGVLIFDRFPHCRLTIALAR